MFGTVTRGPKITRFLIEYTLRNGCAIYEVIQVSNAELDTARYDLYGHVLDRLCTKLEERVQRHIG